jgi:Lar family restriction alleviation protein
MATPTSCPHCGKTDSEVVAAEFEGDKKRVECFSCGATGPLGNTEDDAVALWNRRAPVVGCDLGAKWAEWQKANPVVRAND